MGLFTAFLGYKLKEQGKRRVKIDEWTFSRECGFLLDRDWNAAINIKNEGSFLLELS